MKGRKSRPNPKRRIDTAVSPEARLALAERVSYGRNPEHKRNPGDFTLSPPLTRVRTSPSATPSTSSAGLRRLRSFRSASALVR